MTTDPREASSKAKKTVLREKVPTANTREVAFKDRLQVFLNKLLKNILPVQEERMKYLELKPMEVWIRAFTHKSYSSTDNYEADETLGDVTVNMLFIAQLRSASPELSSMALSELKNTYMATNQQNNMAQKLDLTSYVRKNEAALSASESHKIGSDLFEAFFGGLFEVSKLVQYQNGITDPDKVIGPAIVNCSSMMRFILKDVEIDPEAMKGHPKTQIQQMFSRFGPHFVINEESTELKSGQSQVAISLNKDIMQFLKGSGVSILDPTIGSSTASNSRVALNQAYANALATLKSLGVTSEWVIQKKREMDIQRPDLDIAYRKALARAKTEGYDKIFFEEPNRSRSTTRAERGHLVELRAQKADGTEAVVKTAYLENKDSIGLRKLLNDYAERLGSGENATTELITHESTRASSPRASSRTSSFTNEVQLKKPETKKAPRRKTPRKESPESSSDSDYSS